MNCYKYQKGFSLIEAIVALGVFAMLAASVSSTTGLGYLSERQSGERIIAQGYATEAIGAAKSIRRRGWSELVNGDHGLQKTSGYWEFNGTEDILGNYTRKTTISDVYRDGGGDIVPQGQGNLDQHTKLVTVVVSWELSPSNNNEFTVNNYLTNWQSHNWSQTNWSNGDAQASWSDEGSFWTASPSVETNTIGEIKLKTVGTIPSPYALLMHMDGPRYIDADIVDNYSFENYSGSSPNVNWNDWTEIKYGATTETTAGVGEGLGARVNLQWPMSLGALDQTTIPIDGDTTYQLSFSVKGDVSYFYFVLRDEDYYYLRSDGNFTWWSTAISVSTDNDWSQYNIVFTTRGNANYLYLTFYGWAFNWNQWFAVDEVSLSREVVYDDGSYANHGYKVPDDDDGPNYSSGNFSDALDFDGASGTNRGDAIRVPASDSLDISSAITLEAWIRPDQLGNDYNPIINKWTWSGGDYRSYRLTVSPNDKLEFFISSDGQNGNGHEYSVSSGDKIKEDEWQHVVGVYDGAEMSVYIDGDPKGSMNYSDGIFQSGDNSNVMIGSIDNNLHDDYRFNGRIDEVSIENIALNDTQVYDHFINSPLTPESAITWTAPVPVGIFMADKKVAGMHVSGDYLYLALLDKKRVEVFDLSTNPENPTSLGIFNTTNRSEDVFTYGNYIYVMTDTSSPGLEVYQYSVTPIDAQFVGNINLNDNPTGLWIDGDILYIALEDKSVGVYNLATSPTAPTYLGDFTTTEVSTDISIYGDYAYVSLNNESQALQTFDISIDPANPNSTDVKSAIEEPIGSTVREGYLFLITSGLSRKVLAYNIADSPSAPIALGDFDIADNGWDIATRGSYLYVGLGGSSKGVQVFDMTFMLAGGSGQTNYEVYGSLESSAFDTGAAAGFNFISWTENLPSGEEDIRVQIKTAPTSVGLDTAVWSGPSGGGSYYESGTENIIPASSNHNGDQYVKYLIHLYGSGDDTPILSDININYTP